MALAKIGAGGTEGVDTGVLFKITHGLYLAGAADGARLTGSVVDSVMVVEAHPFQVMASMGKNSATAQAVHKTRLMSLSVLEKDTPAAVIKTFGMRSSRDTDKWGATPHEMVQGVPIRTGSVAGLIVKVVSVFETENHFVFLGDVVRTIAGSMGPALTYADYQATIKTREEKMAEEKQEPKQEKWVCTVCGYVYEGGEPFELLPDDYVCPVCGLGKDVFEKQ
ncbi:MAG: flavin reductase [Alphaproteobacteria bacterium]|nr:flavin reductase [Alphaproteobacteria bacterium]